MPTNRSAQQEPIIERPGQSAGPNVNEVHHHSHFGKTFGLHPAIALFVILINAMIFSSHVFTIIVATILGLLLCVPVGIITYVGQRKWFGDDSVSALLKALILGILTAIPVAIPILLAAPAGIVGWLEGRRQDKANREILQHG